MDTRRAASSKNIDGIQARQTQSGQAYKPETESRNKHSMQVIWRSRKVLIITLGYLTIATLMLLVALIFFNQRQDVSKTEAEAITTSVAKHYVLPNDETPALVTITDKSKVQSAFFLQAENGDKVLIYQKNGLAIIYRPIIDRIVATGPVSISTPKSDN